MGITYYTCHVCSHNFPDCGNYGYCKCGASLCDYCFDQAIKKSGELDENDWEGQVEEWQGPTAMACPNCLLENITDATMLKYILKRIGQTEQQIKQEMRRHLLP